MHYLPLISTAVLLLSGCPGGLTANTDKDYPTDSGPSDLLPDTEDTDSTAPLDTEDTEDTEPENSSPTANAGPDLAVAQGEIASLDGSKSSDPEDDLLSFSWEFLEVPDGSTAQLVNATHFACEFLADITGNYTVELTVSDGLESDTDTVTVFVDSTNSAPVADAGSDQTANVGDLVWLDGSNSYDMNNDVLSYQWEFVSTPSGSNTPLYNATMMSPYFEVDVEGAFTIQLVVDDGMTASLPDTVDISGQSSSGGGGCSCSAPSQDIRQRLTIGQLAYAPGFLLLSLLMWGYQRRP